MEVKKVTITENACAVIDRLKKINGLLMFHQSGGCCDGSQPMCFPLGEFKVSEDHDVKLGDVYGCPFYIARDQYEYWKHTQLQLDVAAGRGSSFSLEIPLGLRFMIHSRLFTDEELVALGLVRSKP